MTDKTCLHKLPDWRDLKPECAKCGLGPCPEDILDDERNRAARAALERVRHQPPSSLRQTHTVVELALSGTAFKEIENNLRAAGYTHAFMPGGEIDMSGICVSIDADEEPSALIPLPPLDLSNYDPSDVEALNDWAVRADRMLRAPRGTDAQILKERSLTVEAIRGAIAFGAQDVNPPPPDKNEWLAPWWQFGRDQQAFEERVGTALRAAETLLVDTLTTLLNIKRELAKETLGALKCQSSIEKIEAWLKPFRDARTPNPADGARPPPGHRPQG